MIGTVEGARLRGALGTDAEITDALTAAALRAHTYCRDLFEPHDAEQRALQLSDGLALAPVRLRAVTAIVSGTTTLPAAAYRLKPMPGMVGSDPDYLGVEVATRGGDGLIVGAEPWNGGWSNLYDATDPTILVTGNWGWASTPGDVTAAVERLAALLLPHPYTPAADAEGTPRAVPRPDDTANPEEEDVPAAGRTDRTTGSAPIDRLLLPYRRAQVAMT